VYSGLKIGTEGVDTEEQRVEKKVQAQSYDHTVHSYPQSLLIENGDMDHI